MMKVLSQKKKPESPGESCGEGNSVFNASSHDCTGHIRAPVPVS